MRDSYPFNISILFLCLFLFISIFPLSELIQINDYNRQRFAQVALLIATARYIFLVDLINIKYKSALLIILSLGLLSTLLSDFLFTALLNYTHFILLGGVVALGYKSRKHIRIIFYLLFLSNILLVSLILLDMSFFVISGEKLNFKKVHFVFSNVRFFNQFQVITLFSLIFALSTPSIRRLALIFIFINFFIMLQTGARGAILSCLLIFFSSFLLKTDKVSKEALTTTSKVLLSSFVFFFIVNLNIGIGNEQLDYTFRYSSSGRIELWEELINRLTIKNIALGSGPGSYVSYLYELGHPHNSVLQILYNWGCVILITVSAMLVHLIKHLLIKKNFFPLEKLTAFATFMSLIVYSLFSGIIVMPLPQTFLFFFWGLLLAYALNIKMETLVLSKRKIIILVIIICIYLLLVLSSKLCIHSPQYGPSYWNHGVISFQSCSLSG